MSTTNTTKKRRHPTTSSPYESDDDTGEQAASLTNKRRGSVAADFAPPRLIVSERQQMAVLKQLTAGEESNTGSHSPSSSLTPQPRPSKINRRNEHGETIVHIVARKGDIKQLKKVLKAGANANEADNAGWTPLHEAVTKNQFKAARLLLKSGANSNAPGPEGQTPLVDAVLNNNTKMAELLLKYSADPSVVDLTRVDETMSKVLKLELSVLDSSDNENDGDDESTSPLSPLTSDNDLEHDDKQNFHSKLVEQLDKNLLQTSTIPKFQYKKTHRELREDSSSYRKSRTVSATVDPSASLVNKNPYDFESEDDDETQDNIDDQQKKKPVRKQRTHSGNSTQSNENFPTKKRPNKIDLHKDSKAKSISDDERLQHIYRVPPLKIVLARAVLQKTPDEETQNSPNMDEDDMNTNLVIDAAAAAAASSPMTIPIIEENDKLFPPVSTNLNRDVDNEQLLSENKSNEHLSIEDNHSQHSNLDSESNQSQSSDTVVFDVINRILTEIENDMSMPMNSLPIIEDDQMDVDEDDEDEEENEDEDDDDEQDNSDKSIATKSNKTEKERTTNRSLISKTDLKPTTRTLRSHARKKSTSTSLLSANNHNTRRVSSRRRALENKLLLNANEKDKKRRQLTERLRKDKDANDDNHASSNSDDQTTESAHGEKYSNPNDDMSSCSSTGAGDGGGSSSTSSSTAVHVKQSTDMECLPPNKRRLRERNHAVNVTESSDQSPNEPTATREIPMNGIRQFLEIRQQIDKRHETMLNEFVLPKIPKDFAETTMAKKSYLVAPSFCSYASTTPASIGIKRYAPPQDLDHHLAEVFSKQEDERYRMKLRHQVERDKLILSHEQEVLRLCGNATRSSVNQEIPFSYCSLLKDNEVYNNPSAPLPEKLLSNDYSSTELGKRGKHRWNGRSFIKWLEDSNLKYKRLSCELNERQRLEVETLYSMQRMVWLKHLPKEASNLSSSSRSSYLLSERYLPKVEINPNFWTNWETNPF